MIGQSFFFSPLPRYTVLFNSTSLYQSWKKYIHHQKVCLQKWMSFCWLPAQPRFWTHGKECVCKVIVLRFLDGDGWFCIEAGRINNMSKAYTLRDFLTLIQWRWKKVKTFCSSNSIITKNEWQFSDSRDPRVLTSDFGWVAGSQHWNSKSKPSLHERMTSATEPNLYILFTARNHQECYTEKVQRGKWWHLL